MHGRVKVKTPAAKEAERKRERDAALQSHRDAWNAVKNLRRCDAAAPDPALIPEHLQLLERLLTKDPDFYTLWNYRRQLLKAMLDASSDERQALIDVELGLTRQCLLIQPKSYSVWSHREWCVRLYAAGEQSPIWRKELKLCNHALSFDERNFHCWDYRRMIVAAACPAIALSDELEYTREKIEENQSNYSAWHYRSTLLLGGASGDRKLSAEQVDSELELVSTAMYLDARDQAVWYYTDWLVDCLPSMLADDGGGGGVADRFRKRLRERLDDLLELELEALGERNVRLAILKLDARAGVESTAEQIARLAELDPLRTNCFPELISALQNSQ